MSFNKDCVFGLCLSTGYYLKTFVMYFKEVGALQDAEILPL